MADPGAVPITLRADAATRAVVDVCDGIDRVMGDRRLYGRMLQRFRRDYQRGVAPLRGVRAGAERLDAECFASSLAGASGMIGAKALQRQASLVGAALRQPGSRGADEVELKKLETALGKVMRVLDQMLFGDAPPEMPGVATPGAAAPPQRAAQGAPARAERGLPEVAAAPAKAQPKPAPVARGPKRLTATAIVYYESAPPKPTRDDMKRAREARTIAETYARQVLGLQGRLDAAVHGVNSWKAFHADFARYERIGRAVFMFHGSQGAMQLGYEGKDLSLIADAFGKAPPQVDQIDFEACNVGSDAPQLVTFGRKLKATKVRGWNMFWVPQIVDVKVGDKRDIHKLTAKIAPYRPWLMPNSPTDEQMFKRGGRWQLVAEWFRPDYSYDKIPPAPGPGQIDGRRMIFRPRSSAADVVVSAADAATFAASMVHQLTHVVVDLSPPAKPPAAPAGGSSHAR